MVNPIADCTPSPHLSHPSAPAQLNIAAFVTGYDTPIGHPSKYRDPDLPTLETATTAELLAAYPDFGSGIRGVLGCIAKPNKWYINMVHPHLPTYANGRVAVLGDAVSLV